MTRGLSGFSRGSLGLAGAVLLLALTAGVASAQTLPPGTLEQLDQLIGSRIETFSVLDTQTGASGGTYASKLNDTDLAITRVTGRGDVAGKRPLGDSGILWSPVPEGTSHFYQAGGRFVMDVQGLFWKLEYVGVGAGYFWSDNFSGWTIGAEISLAF